MPSKVAGFFLLSDIELSIVWAFAQRKRCTPHFEDTELGNRLARAMRRVCPVFGSTWSKFLTVALKPGKGIPAHEHKRHAVLWYAEACRVNVSKEMRHVPAFSMLYLPPATTHYVPPHDERRLSVAMLVDV